MRKKRKKNTSGYCVHPTFRMSHALRIATSGRVWRRHVARDSSLGDKRLFSKASNKEMARGRVLLHVSQHEVVVPQYTGSRVGSEPWSVLPQSFGTTQVSIRPQATSWHRSRHSHRSLAWTWRALIRTLTHSHSAGKRTAPRKRCERLGWISDLSVRHNAVYITFHYIYNI